MMAVFCGFTSVRSLSVREVATFRCILGIGLFAVLDYSWDLAGNRNYLEESSRWVWQVYLCGEVTAVWDWKEA